MLTVDVITLFPEMFAPAIGLSIVGRAVERGLVTVQLHHLLDSCEGSERADDTAYGGGPGMVLRLEPLARALDGILGAATENERRAIVLTTPAGKQFVQDDAERFAGLDRLVLICGHYEGVDQRLGSLYPLEELSLGDFVLTGGEIPALAVLDATVRLLEGAISPDSAAGEAFATSYTRPPRFRGVAVPDVLLSGDHAKIAAWRREESRRRATRRRNSQ
ncbi:MAG: tRNA (guanosine(37)-N1)-methyltransferase TrmD [Vulcanimicrobiaceae bacterium]